MGDHPNKRQILFVYERWGLVKYSTTSTTVFMLHSCGEDFKEEGIVQQQPAHLSRSLRIRGEMKCWRCNAIVPDEILTIEALYNG